MIIHRYHDGSEGYEYQVGDRVIVERTIHGGWFDYGPTRSERCTVETIKHFKVKSWRTADLYIRYSDEWGAAFCYPWMIKPHPEAMISAQVVLEYDPAPQPNVKAEEEHRCPICEEAFKPDDNCATDIELGTCHFDCLDGSPVVDLETGEEILDDDMHSFPYSDIMEPSPGRNSRGKPLWQQDAENAEAGAKAIAELLNSEPTPQTHVDGSKRQLEVEDVGDPTAWLFHEEPPEFEQAKAKLELWFFRDMFESNRLALFSLFGFKPADMDTMGKQQMVFRRILAALATEGK